ncbi:MAG: dipicolinate synthase subunit DpsA [Actinomycetota bacterium]|nr:dipicolinate synthase subunit DpsA [Actinomycetota bacterium]
MSGAPRSSSVAPSAPDWLRDRVVAVVGGDAREQEIARLAAAGGATVRAYGFPWPDGGIDGVGLARSAGEAMDGADYALFPIPGIAVDGRLYAPAVDEVIVPGADLLSRLRRGAAVLLGRADERLRAAALATGHPLLEYEDDTELMLQRGPAVVEGVLAVAVQHTPVTIHGSEVGVVGFGNIGGLLSRSLVALHANVTVFARSPVQRAAADAAGCAPRPLEDLAAVAPSLAMLFSTAPAPVVSRPVLEVMARRSLVVDVAAPPGGIDLAAARALGLEAVWARGMGASAPVTVGRSQWAGIARRIADVERNGGEREG